MRLLSLLLLLLVPFVSGCDSGGSDSDPSIGGTYSGTQTSGSVTGRVSLVIPTTTSGTFTLGSASSITLTINGRTETTPLTGSGSYDYPTVRLATTSDDETDQLTGTVNASGSSITFTDDDGGSLTVTR